jgi:hypothetical protein
MNLNQLLDVSPRRAIVLLGAFIVIAGFAVALVSLNSSQSGQFSAAQGASYPVAGLNGSNDLLNVIGNGNGASYPYGSTEHVVSSTTMATTATSTTMGNPTYPVQGSVTSTTGRQSAYNSTTGTGSLLEFSSYVTIESATPQSTASQVVAMAYGVGGYVAYQATYTNSAYVVIRVPASQYQSTLAKVQTFGKVDSLTSNSNDVSVQYTDLNATLQSLRAEQSDLLRFLNQSTNITTTLNIESQLQGVNAQINSIESQILQTKTLISYSTIDVTINQSATTSPLSMVLKAAPVSGTVPFSVTLDAVVKGGAQPYLVNWNFGDGTADQGQILIHTYYQAGDFNVTATVTDNNGTAVTQSVKVHVAAAPGQSAIGGFLGTVSGLFVSVVEGIVEVAVVVLPLAAVGALVIFPFRKRIRAQKEIKQG